MNAIYVASRNRFHMDSSASPSAIRCRPQRDTTTERHYDMTKKEAFETHIQPLIAQVLEACKEHKINAATLFALDVSEDGSSLTSHVAIMPCDPDDAEGIARINECRRVMVPDPLEEFIRAIFEGVEEADCNDPECPVHGANAEMAS